MRSFGNCSPATPSRNTTHLGSFAAENMTMKLSHSYSYSPTTWSSRGDPKLVPDCDWYYSFATPPSQSSTYPSRFRFYPPITQSQREEILGRPDPETPTHSYTVPYHLPTKTVQELPHPSLTKVLWNHKRKVTDLGRHWRQQECSCKKFAKQHPRAQLHEGHVATGMETLSMPPSLAASNTQQRGWQQRILSVKEKITGAIYGFVSALDHPSPIPTRSTHPRRVPGTLSTRMGITHQAAAAGTQTYPTKSSSTSSPFSRTSTLCTTRTTPMRTSWYIARTSITTPPTTLGWTKQHFTYLTKRLTRSRTRCDTTHQSKSPNTTASCSRSTNRSHTATS